MKRYDVIIVGAGVVGTAIARELSRYKLKTAVLEKEEELAFSVSKSNSGIIHPGTQNKPDLIKGPLCVKGNALMREVAWELGVDFKEVGELIVAFTKEDEQRLAVLKKEGELLGVSQLQIVDTTWLREHEPNLTHEACAALYAPTAGIISPYRLVYDLSENAVRNGVAIHTRTKVERIERIAGKAAGRRTPYFTIETPRGTFTSRYLVNAAGLFADDIARMVGIDSFTIRPRKGEEFLLDKKLEYLTNHLIFPLPTKTSKGILVIKTADGNPMIGPTAVDIDDKEDLSTTDEGYAEVLASVKRLVPAIDGNDIIAYFAGLRPVAGSDFIIRHENAVPGFINVAGIQSPGLTAAPAIALMVCDILQKSGLKLNPKKVFHKHRNRTVHLFTVPLRIAKSLIKNDSSYGDIVCRCETVSAKEVRDAIKRGATTLDGIKFRTRAQAGRCHGSFCTARLLKILSEETETPLAAVTKRGRGSEIIQGVRSID